MKKETLIHIFFDKRLKLIVLILCILSSNLQFANYSIEHFYYNETDKSYYKQYNASYYNSISNQGIYYNFSNHNKIIVKQSIFLINEPVIQYSDFINFNNKEKIKNCTTEKYILYQDTILFDKSYDITNQMKKNNVTVFMQ